MRSADITYVIQGPICASTPTLIRSLVAHDREIPIVVSTWVDQEFSDLQELVRELPQITIVKSECPPALDCGPERWFANINRMIVSTRRGLEMVTTPFALKLRSDTLVDSLRLSHHSLVGGSQLLCQDFVSAYEYDKSSSRDSRIVMCWSLTHYPFFAYYISDWFHFGRTDQLLRLWSLPLASQADAAYFEQRPMVKSFFAHFGQYQSTDFYARFHSEQYLCLKYLERMGEKIDFDHRNDWSICKLSDSYAFLAKYFVVVDRGSIPFILPTHPARSRFGSLLLFRVAGGITSGWVRCVFLFGVYLIYAHVRVLRALIQRFKFLVNNKRS